MKNELFDAPMDFKMGLIGMARLLALAQGLQVTLDKQIPESKLPSGFAEGLVEYAFGSRADDIAELLIEEGVPNDCEFERSSVAMDACKLEDATESVVEGFDFGVVEA